jgi:hypothetical protein
MQPFFLRINRRKNDFITKARKYENTKKNEISFITDSACFVAPWGAKHLTPE